MTPVGPETKTKVPHYTAPRLTQKSPGQRTELDTTSLAYRLKSMILRLDILLRSLSIFISCHFLINPLLLKSVLMFLLSTSKNFLLYMSKFTKIGN